MTEDSEKLHALVKQVYDIATKNGWAFASIVRITINNDAIYAGACYATPESLEQIKDEGHEGVSLLTCLAEVSEAMDRHEPKESK